MIYISHGIFSGKNIFNIEGCLAGFEEKPAVFSTIFGITKIFRTFCASSPYYKNSLAYFWNRKGCGHGWKHVKFSLEYAGRGPLLVVGGRYWRRGPIFGVRGS